jgi:hypothetical protein
MNRTALFALSLALCQPAASMADGEIRPPAPDWRTDPESCTWQWREGGGLGLWTETCDIADETWQVVWDADAAAFVTRRGDTVMGIAVQGFDMPPGPGIDGLGATLIAAGQLDPQAPCAWQPIALRPVPRTMTVHVLAPSDPAALAPDADGQVPDPVCGSYGASTHGVRYFLTDLRWPDHAVFVDEGQERPLFDPSSITRLP